MKEDKKPRRALVTGATGFIGKHLCNELKTRYEVLFGTYRSVQKREALISNGITPVEFDVADKKFASGMRDKLPEVDAVFHLAGKLAGSLSSLLQVNGEGTRLLASHYAAQTLPPRFVYISSIAAAGPATQDKPRHESDPPDPISDYGTSKLQGERSVSIYSDKMPITIVRPGIVFGEGDTEFIQILKSLHRLRFCPAVKSSDQPLAFVEVSDLIKLIIAASEEGEIVPPFQEYDSPEFLGQGIYNGADSQPLSLNQIKDLYREVTGNYALTIALPHAIGWFAGCLAELGRSTLGTKTTLSRDKIREATTVGWCVTSNKAQEQLGWTPQFPIEETIRRWIRQSLALSKWGGREASPHHNPTR